MWGMRVNLDIKLLLMGNSPLANLLPAGIFEKIYIFLKGLGAREILGTRILATAKPSGMG